MIDRDRLPQCGGVAGQVLLATAFAGLTVVLGCARQDQPPTTGTTAEDPPMTQPISDGTGPYHTTDLWNATPEKIGTWKRVAAYGRLKSSHGFGDEPPTAAAHYADGRHVIVVTLTDWGTNADMMGPSPDLVGTRETDAGTMTIEQVRGRWVQSCVYRKPYQLEVVARFNYNMMMDPKAEPMSNGLAFMKQVKLANGTIVMVSGPEDVDLAMMQRVYDAIDLDRIERMPRPAAKAE